MMPLWIGAYIPGLHSITVIVCVRLVLKSSNMEKCVQEGLILNKFRCESTTFQSLQMQPLITFQVILFKFYNGGRNLYLI